MAELLLFESESEVQAAALDILERLGAVATLTETRADGWLDRVADEVPNLKQITAITGERTLAYAIILGIQIRTLSIDRRSVANTTVEFTIGDSQIQTLTLGELRARMIQSLVHDQRALPEVLLPLSADEAMEVIGTRTLLLAPLFNISLELLAAVSVTPGEPRYVVGFVDDHGFTFMDLLDLVALLKGRVRRDLAGNSEVPFQLDLKAVEVARRAAERGDTDQVVATLQSWPGLLSVLHRTPVMQQLDNEQRRTIAEGLRLLGDAFAERDRQSWAEELYRLGLQFAREGEAAGRLFQALGRLLAASGRHAEAIGLFRRALALGLPAVEIQPALGRAFLRAGKVVPALVLIDHHRAETGETAALAEERAEAVRRLAAAGVSWDGLVSPPIPEP